MSCRYLGRGYPAMDCDPPRVPALSQGQGITNRTLRGPTVQLAAPAIAAAN